MQKSCPGENHIISFYSRKNCPEWQPQKIRGEAIFFANYIIIGMFDKNLKNKFLVKKNLHLQKNAYNNFCKVKK